MDPNRRPSQRAGKTYDTTMRFARDLIQLVPKPCTLVACRTAPAANSRLPPSIRLKRLTEVRAQEHSTALLHNTQSFLRNLSNGAEIFLVGTAHISKQSADEVREVIQAVKPDTIFVELCEQRAKRLRSLHSEGSFIEQIMNMFSGAAGGTSSIAELFMRGFYKYLEAIGFNPGMEFKVAMQEASARNATLVLGDQPVDITMRKLSEALTMQEMLSLMMGGMQAPPPELKDLYTSMSSLDNIVEGMKRRSVVKQMHDAMERTNPNLINILVHERNAFMVEQLYQLEGRIVGVVGLGHLDGMERLWDKKQGSL